VDALFGPVGGGSRALPLPAGHGDIGALIQAPRINLRLSISANPLG
jgi:hypothetical protein